MITIATLNQGLHHLTFNHSSFKANRLNLTVKRHFQGNNMTSLHPNFNAGMKCSCTWIITLEMSFKCLNAAETGCINEYLRQLSYAIWVVADRLKFKEGIGFGSGERMAFFWTIEKLALDINSIREAEISVSTSPFSRREAFKCTTVGPQHSEL